MPRIYTSASDPIDFCRPCFEAIGGEEFARERFGIDACGEGPDDRGDCFGYEAEHPAYEDTDYRCEDCNAALSEADD